MTSTHIPFSAEHLDYAEEEHISRMMIGDPKAMAWAWIWSYAQGLSDDRDPEDDYYGSNVTADELIEYAMTWINTNDRWGGDYLSKGGLLEGIRTDPTFWDKLAVLKDLEIPSEKRNNFFSCSC